jgi:hypothetical protein
MKLNVYHLQWLLQLHFFECPPLWLLCNVHQIRPRDFIPNCSSFPTPLSLSGLNSVTGDEAKEKQICIALPCCICYISILSLSRMTCGLTGIGNIDIKQLIYVLNTFRPWRQNCAGHVSTRGAAWRCGVDEGKRKYKVTAELSCSEHKLGRAHFAQGIHLRAT